MLRFLSVFAAFITSVLCASATEYDTLRISWQNKLTGDSLAARSASSLNTKAAGYQGTITAGVMTGATTGYLWSDLPLGVQAGVNADTASGNIVATFKRLEDMAVAYAIPACALYQNPALLAAITSGLDWMTANFYTPTTTLYGNWFDWEISGPQSLSNTEVLLLSNLSALTTTQIANYCKSFYNFGPDSFNQKDYFFWGALTGSNTSNCVLTMALQGILLNTNTTTVTRFWHNTAGHPVNPQTGYTISGTGLLNEAKGNLSGANPLDFSGKSVFSYVTNGDGFYTDGSFVFHANIAYNGQYGKTLVSDVADIVSLLNGSTWAITDPNLANVYSWITTGFEPFMYNGALMDMIRGRSASWSSATEYDAGADVIADIRKVATFAPPATAATLTAFADSPRLASGQFHFGAMDRVVALRSGFGVGLSMSSSRIGNFENLFASSNLKGWFTGDGMTYLYLGVTDTQFTDDYWPTVDYYHLPGTTVEQTYVPQPGTTDQSWVGGAQVSGTYGVAGMALHPAASSSASSTLNGKKSWFMLDNSVVCLGAGVTCTTGGHEIHTTVENRRLGASPTNNFTANGTVYPPVIGWSSSLASTTWCALDGVAGYYFPGGAGNLRASFEANSGAWSDIKVGDSATVYTDNYLKLYFNHGATPTNATYAYVVLPGASASMTGAYAQNPDVVVLSNTSGTNGVQAVKKIGLGIVAANFWGVNGGTADMVTVSKQASVIKSETYNTISVGVSDPTQSNAGTITVTLNRAATGTISVDSGVTVTALSPKIILSVAVNGAKGKSFNASFSQAAQPPVITSAGAATGVQTQAFSYAITASNTPTSYAASGLPAGLSVDAATGIISGTPTATGTSTVSISATNSGGTASATLTLTVNLPPPAITSSLSLLGAINRPFSYPITASNGATSFNASGLPAGLSVDTGTGVISGTPTAAGTSNVTLSATGAGGTGTANATLVVIATATTFTATNTWTCPSGVTSIQVECWGGGGAGGSANRVGAAGSVQYGGGGAGGAYARKVAVSVTPGTTYFINVGAGGINASGVQGTAVAGGDSWLNSTNTPSSVNLAKGGAGGASAIGNTSTTALGVGGTGTATGSIGDSAFAGGSGATSTGSTGTGSGGGGSSAGNGANGVAATSNAGATAPSGGGNGGTGVTSGSVSGTNGSVPGGGGGGARNSSGTTTAGGAGAAGQVIISVNNISSNADLANLTVSGAALSPTFFASTLGYAGSVPFATSTITVTPTVSDGTATVKVNSVTVASGNASGAINLNVGVNTITAVVTAQDGSTMKTYTVSITRQTNVESWRQLNFGTSANTGTAADSADFDGDGLTNLQEYIFGTLPNAAQSPLLTSSLVGGNLTFTFVAKQAAGSGYTGLTRFYDLQTTTNLADPLSWQPVAGYGGIVGNNQTVTATLPASGAQGFFRLKAWLQ